MTMFKWLRKHFDHDLYSKTPEELAELRRRRERATLRILELEQSVLERRAPHRDDDDRYRQRDRA